MVLQNLSIKRGKIGVNYVTQIVDTNNCNFTPVPQENDVGIDGYIEIFNESRIPTGEILCVQIKTGKSYYDISKGICSFPVDNHKDYWLSLRNMVFGIVCVLDDMETHVIRAYWVDIKQELKKNPTCSKIIFSMNITNEFTEEAFRKFFLALSNFKLPNISFCEAQQLVDGTSIDRDIGLKCLCVKYAQYIKSWEILIKQYYKNRTALDLFFFTDSISYIFSHPDHMYIKGCYEFSDESKNYIKNFVENMSEEDMICMLELIDDDGIGRGTIGQSIEIIFENIENEENKLINIINDSDDYYIGQNAEVILAYHHPNTYLKILKELDTSDSEYSDMICKIIKENGYLDIY